MIRAKSQRARNRSPISATAALIAAFAIAFVVTLIAAFAIALGSASVAQAVPPHGPYTTLADDCATCHRSHTSKNRNLLKAATPVSNLCFTCHDGTGSPPVSNVQAQYSVGSTNNVAARVFFRHDALVANTPHTRASLSTDPLEALNRHSECTDCHNPHKVNALTSSTQTTTGWTASGRLAGISGVSVGSAAANTARTYTFLDGITTPITREYQLCYKCHSGFTTQLANLTVGSLEVKSRDRLDKGMEFNPDNLSFHPIEGLGKNRSAAMVLSLSGPSPYRRFTFTIDSTIRCTHCHGGSGPLITSGSGSTTTLTSGSGSNSQVHISRNAGILRAPYRNRVLKPVGEAFKAAEFELCFMCHAIGPFDGTDSTATNYTKHYGHLNTRTGTNVGGNDIDTLGGSGGNAICAECHFRIHSPTFRNPGTYTGTGRGMVNFAPNVGLLPSWNGSGCGNYTCHGKRH